MSVTTAPDPRLARILAIIRATTQRLAAQRARGATESARRSAENTRCLDDLYVCIADFLTRTPVAPDDYATLVVVLAELERVVYNE